MYTVLHHKMIFLIQYLIDHKINFQFSCPKRARNPRNSKFLIRFSTTACTCNKQIFTASGIKIQDIDIRLSMYEVRAEAAVIIFNIMKIISLSIIVTIYYKFVT